MINKAGEGHEISRLISELEMGFRVNEWNVNGVYIWPYVRIKLYMILLSRSIGERSEVGVKTSFNNHTVAKNKLILGFQYLKIVFKYIAFKLSLKKKQLVFVGSHAQRVKHKDVWFNRFFDSMVATNQLEECVYMLEYQKVYEDSYNYNAIIPLEKYVNYYRKVFFWKANAKLKLPYNLKLEGYNDFLKVVQSELEIRNEQIRIRENELIKWVCKIEFISDFFTMLFKRIEPKKVIFSGYYGWDNLYAAIHTANKLGIETIDYQHGPQTNHMVFSNWSKFPVEGYSLMPVTYWNWDELSKKNIDKWAGVTSNITSKVVGQADLAFYKNEITNNKEKHSIFYSLQTFSLKEMIPTCVINLVKNREFQWIFRLHPRSEFTEKELETFLLKNVGENIDFEIQHSKSVPINETLMSSFLHITCFSGCLLEARIMGVPSIVIHEMGNEMFREYIDNKLVFFIDKEDSNFIEDFNKTVSTIKRDYKPEALEVINPLN